MDGAPVDGPSLELDPESAASARLRQSSHPLVSDPVSETWATLLERPESGETDRPVLVQWVSSDSPAPPAHYHPKTETFTALDGRLTVVRDGDPVRLDPGESLTVDAGVAHTFRNDTAGPVAFEAELPSMRTVKGLYTAWGLAHERGTDGDGTFAGPGPVQSLLIAADLSTETTMTAVPVSVQRLLWATVGRLARLSGTTGIDEAYLDASFWNRHVEQPAWEDSADVAY
ncbi:cupin domain-containing protein [Haloarcula pelagica]|uniref:cupin domain-containing protein n=1 Tax=Haloarcula pelagica TaxID=3033389 RepID=UPI0024C311BF|nr:cupin domain-containing protein [Halomicroarcula sp. YJ-61-S]